MTSYFRDKSACARLESIKRLSTQRMGDLKVAVVVGTRPEIIKMSPIIRALEQKEVDFFIPHTGQHYDYEMDGAFFDELNLPKPKYNLGVGSGSHGQQCARIMVESEKVLLKEAPDITLVQGDTNTVLSVSLVASKLHLPLGHVEAGLRSFDRRMPEEINRVVADHLADLLFAPTEVSKNNLLREGVSPNSIHVTGNTVVDAVHQNLALSEGKASILGTYGLEDNGYFLVTLHRAENVDDAYKLQGILSALRKISELHGLPVVFPVHPRTKKMIDKFGLSRGGLVAIQPLGYLEFLSLASRAKLLLTDSGGVQEEACVLGKPCVTLRENTERPETIEVGANVLAGTGVEGIIAAVEKMIWVKSGWVNPYGDGNSGGRIVTIIEDWIKRG